MQNFFAQFDDAARRFSGRTAVEVQHRDRLDAFRYADLLEMAERTAAWLAMLPVAAGDRCAILADNDAHWCGAYLGILRRGAVAVPLDTAYKAPQVATLLRDCAPAVFFTTLRYLPIVMEARAAVGSGCRVVLLHGEADQTVSFELMVGGRMPAPPLPPCPATPGDPAVILYTSGTTADPKGVVLTHANLLAERTAAFQVVRVTEHDCVLGVLPLFHALAQMANLLLPFSIGARVVFLESVNTTELLRALAERGVTIFVCVPQFFYLIHQRVTAQVARAGPLGRGAFRAALAAGGGLRRLGLNVGPILFRRVHAVLGGRMRLMVTGGSRFDPAIAADLYAMGFTIVQAYGLTETSGAATCQRPGTPPADSVGPPLPGVEIRIDAPDAGGEEGDGEVLIRGPVVMAGYYNRPDATAAALDDGWLRTGDLGRLDAGGQLAITGRKKELIVLSSGKNIYPEEIEAHYRRSVFVKEICVLGLARPGEPSAERLHAVVVPDPDVLRERKIVNAGDIIRFEMEGASIDLPAHKRVLGYDVWMEALPRTTTGKLKRHEIEKRVRAAAAARTGVEAPLSGDAEAWLAREDVAPVVAVIARSVRGGRAVRPDDNLELDLGLDSMERVELLTALSMQLGATVPEEETHRIFTVRELVEAVQRHGTGEARDGAAVAWDHLLASGAFDERPFAEALQRHPVTGRALYVLLLVLLRIARLVVRVEVRGVEHLPDRGPYLLSPNHQSYLDPFFMVGALPWRVTRELFFVGASEYFANPLTRWLARQINLVPVDPDASLVPAMQAGACGLRRGRVLVLFPEGERSIDGTVRTFKKGAAILSHHLQVPIVPVAIDGLFEIWPRNRGVAWAKLRPWRRARVAVTVGPPLEPREAADRAGDATAAYVAITAAARERVQRMWDALQAAGGSAD